MTTRPRFNLRLSLPDAEATTALGHRIAPLLAPAHTILLEGPIGAGKTHLARALIQKRLQDDGRTEDVPSPTFTLVQVYQTTDCDIWHADLYRLADPCETIELGLDDAFARAICLVEWPDRLGTATPRHAARLRLTPSADGDARLAEITADDERWASVFSTFENAHD